MSALPLISGHELDSPFAQQRDGTVITAGRFLTHARRLAELLPEQSRIINLCEDRYYFLLAFAASLLSGKTILLPPNRAHDTIAQLHDEHADSLLLSDRAEEYAEFGCLDVTLPLPESDAKTIPAIDAAHPAAILYTSGSSGHATPHQKSWGMLVESAKLTAQRLMVPRGATLLATVPPQHMFGLESSVMLPLQNGCTIANQRPLFPADISAALEALPAPRALITTPLQLRACSEAGQALPPCAFILSATAPLSLELAQQVEVLCDTTIQEIYGSTETGAIATRATATETSWLPLPGYSLQQHEDGWWLHAPTLPAPQQLADRLQLEGDRFSLLGRSSDLIKIAGKRVSLTELNYILLAIEGVDDGVFFLPEGREDGATTRLAAVVVSSVLSDAELFERLRQRIDAAFLPRPLLIVEQLPRNELGKLPRQALLALFEKQQKSA